MVEVYGGSPETFDQRSCPYVIQALLRSLPTDEVLRKVHGAVARAEHTDREDEEKFAERSSKAARIFRHVFKSDELVHLYVHGPKNAVHEMMAHLVRHFPHANQSNLSAYRKGTVAVGRSQRTLRSDVEKWRSIHRNQEQGGRSRKI